MWIHPPIIVCKPVIIALVHSWDTHTSKLFSKLKQDGTFLVKNFKCKCMKTLDSMCTSEVFHNPKDEIGRHTNNLCIVTTLAASGSAQSKSCPPVIAACSWNDFFFSSWEWLHFCFYYCSQSILVFPLSSSGIAERSPFSINLQFDTSFCTNSGCSSEHVWTAPWWGSGHSSVSLR